jgi:hypothetical protein
MIRLRAPGMSVGMVVRSLLFLGLFYGFGARSSRTQDNYEIQVYSYDTVEPGHRMVELHSNFTIDGSKTVVDGVLPSNHAQHETIEITHGFTDWSKWVFTSSRTSATGRGCNGSAITYARDSACPQNGNGQSG